MLITISDKPGITIGVSTVFAIVSFLTRVATLPKRRMCAFVSDLCADTTIKGLQISEPVSVIVLVGILHHSPVDRCDIESRLSHEN